jgi:hypothetical protein
MPGCVMKNTWFIVQPVKASVTVKLHKPADKLDVLGLVKLVVPFVHR